MRVIPESLPDYSSSDFAVLHLETEIDGVHDDNVERLVVANGYLEDISTLHKSAAGMIALAEAAGRPMRVTMHDSPLHGKSAYGLDYRTERYAKVVDHATRDGNLPVRLVGHSWGLPQIVRVGTQLLDEGATVESVVGHNPNGLTPIVLNPKTVLGMAYAGLREARLQKALLAKLGGSVGAEVPDLGRKARLHVGSNIPAAFLEGRGLLTHDVVQDTVALHQKLAASGVSRMRIIAGKQDGICPSGVMRDNLLEAGYPDEDFIELDTFHGGPLVDPSYTPLLYDAVMLNPTQRY